MYAIVVYEFDDEKYKEMRQWDANPEVIAAQIAYAVTQQGEQHVILYIQDVSLHDILEAVECML